MEDINKLLATITQDVAVPPEKQPKNTQTPIRYETVIVVEEMRKFLQENKDIIIKKVRRRIQHIQRKKETLEKKRAKSKEANDNTDPKLRIIP